MEARQQIAADYITAYKRANGTTPTVTYAKGWYQVTVRGWMTSKHRAGDLISMTSTLNYRADAKQARATGQEGR